MKNLISPTFVSLVLLSSLSICRADETPNQMRARLHLKDGAPIPAKEMVKEHPLTPEEEAAAARAEIERKREERECPPLIISFTKMMQAMADSSMGALYGDDIEKFCRAYDRCTLSCSSGKCREAITSVFGNGDKFVFNCMNRNN